MEHEQQTLRQMRETICDLESRRLRDELRADDRKLFLMLLGLVAAAGLFLSITPDVIRLSASAVIWLRAATWALFAYAGLGILYVLVMQMRLNDRARKDNARLKAMQMRALSRSESINCA